MPSEHTFTLWPYPEGLGMSFFLNPWMLLAGLLMLIPILIHLFNRTKYRIEPWGAMMFLEKAAEVRSKRIRIEQWLLLALRCLFFALLALAVARPIMKWGDGESDEPTTHVLVFDDSYSMQQGEGEDNALHMARESAFEVIESMKDEDNMLIVRAGNKPRPLFTRPSFDKKYLHAQIEDMEAGTAQAMNLPQAMEMVYFLLGKSTLPRHRILLLTDGQKHGWRLEAEGRWSKVDTAREALKIAPTMYVLSQAPEGKLVNLSVESVVSRSPVVDVFQTATFLVDVHNRDNDEQAVTLEFRVDDRMQAEKNVTVPPGRHTYEFNHQFSRVNEVGGRRGGKNRKGKEGRKKAPRSKIASTDPASDDAEKPEPEFRTHTVTVDLHDDDLDADNQFVLAVEVRHRIPILIIDNEPTSDILESDGGVLAMALEAGGGMFERGLFDVTHQSLFDMVDLSLTTLESYRAVVLANIPSLSRNMQFGLEQFAEGGGGIFFICGDQMDPEAINRLADDSGLIPGRLLGEKNYLEEEPETENARPQVYHPRFPAGAAGHVLNIFDTSRERTLRQVRVRRYWEVEPLPETLRIATFGEDPALLYRPYGKGSRNTDGVTSAPGSGRVMMWTSSVNLDWTNVAITDDFLPLFQNLMLFLAASAETPINLAQGDSLLVSQLVPQASESGALEADDPANPANWTTNFTVTTPDGDTHPLEGELQGGEWVAEWADTDQPGRYLVEVPGADPIAYAVAYEPGEGDLEALDAEKAGESRADMVTGFTDSMRSVNELVRRETGVTEWWHWFLIIAFLILMVEMYVGWRSSS